MRTASPTLRRAARAEDFLSVIAAQCGSAQRQADAYLFTTRGGSRQRQIGDIRASHQQYQSRNTRREQRTEFENPGYRSISPVELGHNANIHISVLFREEAPQIV